VIQKLNEPVSFCSHSQFLPLLQCSAKRLCCRHQAGSGGSAGFGGGGAFGGVNLIGGISKPPAAAPSLGFMLPLHAPVPAAATAKQVNEPSAEEKQKLSALTKQYLDHIQNLDPRIYDPVGTERFLISYQAIKHPRTVAPAPAEAAAAPVPAAPAPATSGPFSGSTAPAAVAPTPSSAATGNLFSGGSTTPTFSFGGTMATAAAAAGPAPATGLFAGNAGSLFGGSPAPAAPATSVLSLFPAPAPVTTTTTEFGGFATAPSPAVAAAAAASATETGEDDEVEEATEKPLANPDANVTVAFESVLSKVFRNVLDKETQKSKREVVASGNLKLERNNTTGFCQLVLVSCLPSVQKGTAHILP
jgi:hypothetical protein